MVAALLAACGGGGQDSTPQSAQRLSAARISQGGATLSEAVAPTPSVPAALAKTEALLADAEKIHIALTLSLNNVAELDKFVADVQDPNSSNFRQFLSHDEIVRRFGPTEAQIAETVKFLSASGFSNIKPSRDKFMVEADVPASVANRVFQTTLAKYTKSDGKVVHANKTAAILPQALRSSVQGVLGLDTVTEFKTHVVTSASAQRKTMLTPNAAASLVSHNPKELPAIYGVQNTPTAANIKVGIIAQGNMTQTLADLQAYEIENGITPVPTSVVYYNTASSDVSNMIEWNLDSQSIVSMSGGVSKLIFYVAPTMSVVDMLGAISAAVSANEAQVVSMSFGACEQLGFSNTYDSYFKVAVAQGQTFVASTGDTGSTNSGCSGNSVNLPAASRYVVAVGGTTLQTSTVGGYAGETAWSGSGGGYSTISAIPAAQATVVSGDKRALPDIAFVADPNSGVTIRLNGSLVSGVGGTSLSAPLFAATWARMLSQCGNLGFAAPTLYTARNLHLSMFNDITTNNNGGYSAGAGWDAVTGLGTPSISNMWAAVCPSNSAYYPLVQHIYLAYVGRPAEPAGLNNMAASLKNANAPTDISKLDAIYKSNASVSTLLTNTQASSESTTLYPTTNISAYVSALFQTIFNRAPTSAELTKFSSAVSSGTLPIGQLPLSIMNSAPDLYGITTMENRAGVALNFTATLTTATAPYYSGQVAATSARHMLQQVTYSTATDNVFDNNFSQPKYIASMQPLIKSTIANIVAGIPQ